MSEDTNPPAGEDSSPDHTSPDHTSPDHNATEFEEALDDHASSAEYPADEVVDDLLQPMTEIEELTIEVQEFKSMALRLQADFENYRKRITAQQHDDIDRATGKFAESLLPVLDACEAAFAHGADGVEPIWSQLMGILHKQGLEALDLADKPFDPAQADAVMHEAGDGADPVVSEVLRTGYSWKGKTLRPAMVKVKG